MRSIIVVPGVSLRKPSNIGHVHPHPLTSSLLPAECALLLQRGLFNSPREIGFPAVLVLLYKGWGAAKVFDVSASLVRTAIRFSFADSDIATTYY